MQAIFSTHRLSFRASMARPAQKPRPAYGQHLTSLREAAGLTQRQLADKLGVKQSNITFWERWDKPPRGEILPPLATALGVTVDQLLNLKRNPREKTATRSTSRARRMFDALSKMPRRQQDKILDVLEPFVRDYVPADAENGSEVAAHKSR